MRDILFKAKRIDNGEWVEGYYVKTGEASYIVVPYSQADISGAEGSTIEVDANTICQYTGLTDKSGNKIWENDVVKATVIQNSLCQLSTYSDFYQVAYHEKYCYFYLKKKNNNLLFDGNWSYLLKGIEVIGSIFDNPGLIGEKNG